MKLTTQLLVPFIGGQIEVQNQNEGYIYRGEIKAARVTSGELVIGLNWMAKGEGYPPIPTKWVNSDPKNYALSLEISSVSDIGPSGGDVGGGNRLCINCSIVGELVVLYPADGSKLDPSKVEGLVVRA